MVLAETVLQKKKKEDQEKKDCLIYTNKVWYRSKIYFGSAKIHFWRELKQIGISKQILIWNFQTHTDMALVLLDWKVL